MSIPRAVATALAPLAAPLLLGCATVRPSVRDGSVPTYAFFLDRNHAFLASPREGVMYEAQIAPHFLLTQSVERALARVDDTLPPRWRRGTSLAFTPLIRLRQLSETSSPVKTPSFMPKVTAQWIWARRERAAFVDTTRGYSPVRLADVQLVVGHYSNGQAGCLFANRERSQTDPDECVLRPGADPASREINRVDGDFSTHYVRLGADWRRLHVDATRREWLAYGGGASLEQHVPASVIPGGMEEALRDVYGSRRAAAQAEVVLRDSALLARAGLRALGGATRATVYAERAFGAADWVPTSRWSAEVAHTFDRAFGVGLFVRRHQGQDYYNLGFARRLNAWQFGATIDLERRAFFDRPPRALPGRTLPPSSRPTPDR